MIKKIIHVADIHIPNMEDKRPYSIMINGFIADLYKKVKDFNKDEVRIVLVGDIFQQKIKASNEANKMFHEMLNYLNEIAKTYIIAGNHDMLENNQSRMDAITPTFEIDNVYPNIKFLDKEFNYKSGCLIDDGVVWVLYSMFDMFRRPNIESIKEKYPNYKYIGLYHGEVVGATTDIGRMSESGIDTKDFIGCDCVMAGHIHKFQEIKKEGIPIVYSGSLFQKDAGENITGHGYVIWDLDTMKYKHNEVNNDYRIIKISVDSFDDVTNDKERLLNL